MAGHSGFNIAYPVDFGDTLRFAYLNKREYKGEQQRAKKEGDDKDHPTGPLLWEYGLIRMTVDNFGKKTTSTIDVQVASETEPPEFDPFDPVIVDNFVVRPWSSGLGEKARYGVTLTADAVHLATSAPKKQEKPNA